MIRVGMGVGWGGGGSGGGEGCGAIGEECEVWMLDKNLMISANIILHV